MAAYTLLDYVQDIASSLDSEEVNSFDDSVESAQIANIVKTVYHDIASRADLPEHYTVFELTASGTDARPVMMHKPSNIRSILWLKYNKVAYGDTDPVWEDIPFLPLDKFLEHTYAMKPSDADVASFDYSVGSEPDSITFVYRSDKAPSYFTTYDDSTLLFDSYDSEVDTTLQKTKTLCYGLKDQTFTMSNTFVPFLDRDLSMLLLNESKVLAFSELKQVGHDIAKQWAARGWTKIQKSKRNVDHDTSELSRAPNYGRK